MFPNTHALFHSMNVILCHLAERTLLFTSFICVLSVRWLYYQIKQGPGQYSITFQRGQTDSPLSFDKIACLPCYLVENFMLLLNLVNVSLSTGACRQEAACISRKSGSLRGLVLPWKRSVRAMEKTAKENKQFLNRWHLLLDEGNGSLSILNS